MPNYAAYRSEKNITNRDMIETISDTFTGYTKIQNSMIMNPDKYGLMLTPDAEGCLIDKYGGGTGLSSKRGKRKYNRKKNNKLTVRIGDELYNRVRDLMYQLKYDTVQDFLEAALMSMVEQNIEGIE